MPDPSRLFLEVGLGFFVELTLGEATAVVERKTAALGDRANKLTLDACKVGEGEQLILGSFWYFFGLDSDIFWPFLTDFSHFFCLFKVHLMHFWSFLRSL